jgi:predicted secreted protein
MFGQHVLVTGAGQAYAETALIDVQRNDFVPGGWKKSGWDVPMLPNQDSRGALYELLGQSSALKARYGISHLEQGRLLYTRSNGDDAVPAAPAAGSADQSAPALTFRDFERGREYTLTLTQEQQKTGEAVSAAFYIDLKVRRTNGSESSHTTGRKGYFRPDVAAYQVVRVWIAPDDRSLVIAVAKEGTDGSVRYMVETLVVN